jgi:hypothetical protein
MWLCLLLSNPLHPCQRCNKILLPLSLLLLL